eukprot:m51a1_g1623 hypothetical protein (1476) ;mRNA; f:246378-250914
MDAPSSSEADDARRLREILAQRDDDYDDEHLSFDYAASSLAHLLDSPDPLDLDSPSTASAPAPASSSDPGAAVLAAPAHVCCVALCDAPCVSAQLRGDSAAREAGLPTALCCAPGTCAAGDVCVGTSRGLVLAFSDALGAGSLRAVLGGSATADSGAVTSLDAPEGGGGRARERWVLAGYQSGDVVLWDSATGRPARALRAAHAGAVVHARWMGDGRALTCDALGNLFVHAFSAGFAGLAAAVGGGSATETRERLLDGAQTGPVLALEPLLPGSAPWHGDRFCLVALATSHRAYIAGVGSAAPLVMAQQPRMSRGRSEGDAALPPCLAWRRASGGGPAGRLDPVLAVSWGRRVQVVLVSAPPDAEVAADIDAVVVAECDLGEGERAVALSWLAPHTLAAVTARGQIRALDPFAGAAGPRSLDVSAPVPAKHVELVYHTRLASAVTGHALQYFSHCVRRRRARVFLLGLQGLYAAQLLPWDASLQALADQGRWTDALALALAFHAGRAPVAPGMPHDAGEAAVATTVALEDLLRKYVVVGAAQSIERAVAPGAPPTPQELEVCAITLHCCLQLGSLAVAFEDLWPALSRCGRAGALYEALEPHVASGRIAALQRRSPGPVIPTPALLALVEYFAGPAGRPEAAEGFIARLLPTAIDAAAVQPLLSLARSRQLRQAVVMLYNKRLDEYVAPLEELAKELVGEVDDAPGASLKPWSLPEDRRPVALLLLRYVRACLSGKVFDTSPAPTQRLSPAGRVLSVRAVVASHLFTMNVAGDKREYPRLFYLLSSDVAGALEALAPLVTEPLGTTQAEVAQLATKYGVPPTPTSLAEVLAWVTLDPNPRAGSSWRFSNEQQGTLLHFLGRHFSAGILRLSAAVIDRSALFLVSKEAEALFPDREELLHSVVERALEQGLGDPKRFLIMAESSEMHSVSEWLHLRDRAFAKAIASRLKSSRARGGVFDLVAGFMAAGSGLTDAEREQVKACAIASLPQLVSVDSGATVRLINDCLAMEHSAVVAQLAAFPQLQHRYLSGVFRRGGRGADSAPLSPASHHRRESQQVPSELYELYVSLSCQLAPETVVPFLASVEDLPIDVCLQACQRHKHADGVVLLLERAGDVQAALDVLLDDLRKRLSDLKLALHHGGAQPGVVEPLEKATRAAVSLCERNSNKLQDEEQQALWFSLLDVVVLPLRAAKQGGWRGASATNAAPASSPTQSSDLASKALESTSGGASQPQSQQSQGEFASVLSRLTQTVLDSMASSVPLPSIISKVLRDHGGDEFGQFRSVVLGMLEAHTYERGLLVTVNKLLAKDAFHATEARLRLGQRAFPTGDRRCSACRAPLQVASSIIVFNCGHALHDSARAPSPSNRRARSSATHTPPPLSRSPQQAGRRGPAEEHQPEESAAPYMGRLDRYRQYITRERPGMDFLRKLETMDIPRPPSAARRVSQQAQRRERGSPLLGGLALPRQFISAFTSHPEDD